jgi:hypothetical protein
MFAGSMALSHSFPDVEHDVGRDAVWARGDRVGPDPVPRFSRYRGVDLLGLSPPRFRRGHSSEAGKHGLEDRAGRNIISGGVSYDGGQDCIATGWLTATVDEHDECSRVCELM